MARERAFRGASTHSLDDKARLIVPKRFLERLPAIEADFVLTASPDGCLLLLDRQSFEDLTRDIGGSVLEQDARPRDLRRLLLGHAEDVRPDKAGRILIPEALRQYLGLGKEDREVVVVGAGDWIELWKHDRWVTSLDRALAGSLPKSEVESAAG